PSVIKDGTDAPRVHSPPSLWPREAQSLLSNCVALKCPAPLSLGLLSEESLSSSHNNLSPSAIQGRSFTPYPTRRFGAPLGDNVFFYKVEIVSILTQPEGWVLPLAAHRSALRCQQWAVGRKGNPSLLVVFFTSVPLCVERPDSAPRLQGL